MLRGFFLICMGLAFCPSVLELSTFGFILLPFWVPSFVKSLVVTSRLVSVAVCYSLFGEVGVVDPEVLLWFMLCATSVESVLVTLRHDFSPFWVTLFSVEPVLLALRC